MKITRIETEFQISAGQNTYPDVKMLRDDRFITVWQNKQSSGYNIKGRVFSLDGVSVLNEFEIKSYDVSGELFPKIELFASDTFAVTWNKDKYIYVQRWYTNGTSATGASQVNTYTVNAQSHPIIKKLHNGKFVVAWESDQQDGSEHGIYARIFDAEGMPWNDVVQVNGDTYGDQRNPSIGVFSDGRFAIVWNSKKKDGTDDVYSQLFNSEGLKIGLEFQINTYIDGDQKYPDVRVFSNDIFVVTWTSTSQEGTYGQMFNARGEKTGYEFKFSSNQDTSKEVLGDFGYIEVNKKSSSNIEGQVITPKGDVLRDNFSVNTYTNSGIDGVSISAFEDGKFIIVWHGYYSAQGHGIYAQSFTLDSILEKDSDINALIVSNYVNPQIVSFNDDKAITVWHKPDGSSNGIFGQIFDSNGTFFGAEFRVNFYTKGDQKNPHISPLDDKRFVVVWQSDQEVQGRIMSVDNASFENRVSNQTRAVQSNPAVSVFENGDYIVVWQDHTYEHNIYGRFVGKDGLSISEELLINSNFDGSQLNPSVATLNSEDFVVVWESTSGNEGQDVTGESIRGQIFTIDGSRKGDEFIINTNIGSSVRKPTVKVFGNSKFVVIWQANGKDGSKSGVYGKIFSNNDTGSNDSSEFQVNAYIYDDQNNPSIDVFPNNNFVVVWQSKNQEGPKEQIYGQIFNSNGNKQGGEFLISEHINSGCINPSVKVIDSDRFDIVYQKYLGSSSSDALIHIRSFSVNQVIKDFKYSEILVDSDLSDNELFPTIGMFTKEISNDVLFLKDRRLVVVYEANDSSSTGLRGQIIRTSGEKVNEDMPLFSINYYEQNTQGRPKVIVLEGNKFMVVWHSNDQKAEDSSGYAIYRRIFSESGVSDSIEAVTNTYTNSNQNYPDITKFSDDSSVIVWQSQGQDSATYGIYAQVIDKNGAKLGNEIKIMTGSGITANYPSIATLRGDNNQYVVAWQRKYGSYYRIYSKKVIVGENISSNNDGIQISFSNSEHQQYPIIKALSNNSFVIVWRTAHATLARIFDENFTEVTQHFTVIDSNANDNKFDVRVFENDKFVIIWSEVAQKGYGYSVYAQVFDSIGKKVGQIFQVNAYAHVKKSGAPIAAPIPSVVGSDEKLLIIWQGVGLYSSGEGLYGRVISSSDQESLRIESNSSFRVNSYTPNSQSNPQIKKLSDGKFVVAWQGYGSDGLGNEIYAKIVDVFGNTIKEDFRVNSYYSSDQVESSIAVLSNGHFIVAWHGMGQRDTSRHGIYAKIFDSEGMQVKTDFLVSEQYYSSGHQQNPSIAATSDGGYVIVWNGYGGADSTGVHARKYTSNHSGGSEIRVNREYTSSTQHMPFVFAAKDANNFFVIWESSGRDSSGYGIYGQQFSFSGSSISFTLKNFLVNSYTSSNQNYASATLLVDGSFIVTWQSGNNQDGDDNGIFAQKFSASGDKVGREFQVNSYAFDDQEHPSIDSFSDGSFVIVWQSKSQGSSVDKVYGQIFNSNCIKMGSEFFIHNYYSNYLEEFPSATTFDNDKFFVVWQDSGRDGSNYGIYGKVLSIHDVIGFNASTLVSLNKVTKDDYFKMDSLDNGNVLVVWSGSGDGSSNGVYAQVLDTALTPVGKELLINIYTNKEQENPSIATSAGNKVMAVWQGRSYDGSGAWDIYSRIVHLDDVDLEFKVSDYSGVQEIPKVAIFNNKKFVVIWQSNGQDSSGYGVFGRIFSDNATKDGSEFQVNNYISSDQRDPTVKAFEDGKFVVAWQSNSQDGSNYGVYTRFMWTDAIKAAFKITSFDSEQEASEYIHHIAKVSDGGFVSVWQKSGDDASDPSKIGIFAQKFDAENKVECSEFQVNTYVKNDQTNPAVTGFSTGGFVITWNSDKQDGSEWGVYAQVFDSECGKVGNEFQVNRYVYKSQYLPHVGAFENNKFVIVWCSQETEKFDIHGQLFSSKGEKLGGEFRVNLYYLDETQFHPKVATYKDNKFVVVWSSSKQDGDDYGAYTRELLLDVMENTPTSLQFTVINDAENSEVTNYKKYEPRIAMLDSNKFISVWYSDGQEDADYNIYAQKFDSDKKVWENKLLINSYISNNQMNPTVALFNDGDFLTVWQGRGAASSSYDNIYGRAFFEDSQELGSEFRVNYHTSSYKKEYPNIAKLNDTAFIVVWQSGNNQDGAGYGIYGRILTTNNLSDPTNSSDEFKINSNTGSDQRHPSVSVFSDGSFIVSWDSSHLGSYLIQAQQFKSNGQALGEFTVSDSESSGHRYHSEVTVLTDNKFVIMWQFSKKIYGKLFYENRAPFGDGEFEIGADISSDSQRKYYITRALREDDFVVVWTGFRYYKNACLYGQVFEVSSTNVVKKGGIFRINEYFIEESRPDLGIHRGTFSDTLISIWRGVGLSGIGYGIYGKKLKLTDSQNLESHFQVPVTFSSEYLNQFSVATFSVGKSVLVWHEQLDSDFDIYARIIDVDGSIVKWHIAVNSYKNEDQQFPDVAVGKDSFVVTWQSKNQDTDGYGVYVRKFDSDGLNPTIPYQANEYFAGNQENAKVAMFDDESFIVVWQTATSDSGKDIYARQFKSDGTPLKESFLVNANVSGDQVFPTVAAYGNDKFIIVWETNKIISLRTFYKNTLPLSNEDVVVSNNSSGKGKDIAVLNNGTFIIVWVCHFNYDEICAQVFDSSINKIRDAFQVSSGFPANKISPKVSSGKDNAFVVVWNSDKKDDSGSGIFLQRVGVSEQKVGTEIQVNSYHYADQSQPDIGKLIDNKVVVSWYSNWHPTGIYTRTVEFENLELECQANSYTINAQDRADIAIFSNGNYVVTWHGKGVGDDNGVYAQIFGANCEKIGSEFSINTHTSSDQLYPSVDVFSDDNFIITWHSNQDGSDTGIFSQIFYANGTKIGTESQVNLHILGKQLYPKVQTFKDGKFITAWYGEGISGWGIYGQVLYLDKPKIGSEFLVNVNKVTGNQYMPYVISINGQKCMIAWCDGDGYMYRQTFNLDGTRNGPEYAINTHTGSNKNVKVDVFKDGSFVVVWESSEYIYGQRFYENHAIGGVGFQITSEDNNYPNVATLTDGTFIVTWNGAQNYGQKFELSYYTSVFEQIISDFRIFEMLPGSVINPINNPISSEDLAMITDTLSASYTICVIMPEQMLSLVAILNDKYINKDIEKDDEKCINALLQLRVYHKDDSTITYDECMSNMKSEVMSYLDPIVKGDCLVGEVLASELCGTLLQVG